MRITVNPRREAAKQMHAAGMSKSAIARELQVALATVHSWLPGETGKPTFNAELRARANDLVDRGLSRAEIGRELGISRQRVSQILGPVNPEDERKDERVLLYTTKEKVKRLRSIAKDLGLRNERGRNPTAGSIQKLLDGIATGDLTVTKTERD